MTDRELLEAAARAAGHSNFEYCELSGGEPYLWLRGAEEGSQVWSALADDGDAFRLLTHFGFTLEFYLDNKEVNVTACYGDEPLAVEFWGLHKSGATRRAITRAAASLTSEGKDRG